MEEKNKEILEAAEILKIISNATRLEIICYLEEKEMNVNEIKEKFPNISQPAVSQHLNLLKLNRLVSIERRGKQIFYKISDERILSLISSLRSIFCKQ